MRGKCYRSQKTRKVRERRKLGRKSAGGFLKTWFYSFLPCHELKFIITPFKAAESRGEENTFQLKEVKVTAASSVFSIATGNIFGFKLKALHSEWDSCVSDSALKHSGKIKSPCENSVLFPLDSDGFPFG